MLTTLMTILIQSWKKCSCINFYSILDDSLKGNLGSPEHHNAQPLDPNPLEFLQKITGTSSTPSKSCGSHGRHCHASPSIRLRPPSRLRMSNVQCPMSNVQCPLQPLFWRVKIYFGLIWMSFHHSIQFNSTRLLVWNNSLVVFSHW